MARKKKLGASRVDLTLSFGGSLFDDTLLDDLVALLRSHAKPWSSDLHIWWDEKRHVAGSDLAATILTLADERGELYHQLMRNYGPARFPRRTGGVELRGSDDSMIAVLTLDEFAFAPSSGRYLWGNSFALQVGSPGDERDVTKFVREFAEEACRRLAPWYAHGHVPLEYHSKNISDDDGTVMAIGVDISRYLPGLYWLNFFGEPYVELIGKDRLLAAPAHEVKSMDSGVLVCVDEHPSKWSEPDSRSARVLTHIGADYFFDRDDRERATVAPDFGLEPLRRFPRFS